MTYAPMTDDERSAVRLHLAYMPRTAPPALVALVAALADGTDRRSLDAYAGDVSAVIARVMAAEQHIASLRRVLGEVAALAGDNPDVPVTAADVAGLATAAGLDITEDIEAAEELREAEQAAGCPW
jgi:hypothetical protein